MLKPLVKYFIHRKIKADDRSPTAVHGDLILHVAVVAVYGDNQNFQHIRQYVKDLRQRGLKTVDFFIYFPQKKVLEAFEAGSKDIPFYKGSFTWLGKYKSDTLKAAVSNKYDVLIDLTRGQSFGCDVLISKTHARWKAGEQSLNRSHLLDLMIDVKSDPDVQKLIHHLDHYLTNFNKMNAA